jgi:hypothetical protein
MIFRHSSGFFWSSCIAAALLVFGVFSSASACSRLPTQTPAEIFNGAELLFRGIVVGAEAVELPIGEELPQDVVAAVKVKWRSLEVFKGNVPKEGLAYTQYICGGVNIVIGSPYVISLRKLNVSEDPVEFQDFYKSHPGMNWYLDDSGTRSAWERPEEYKKFVKEFQKLGG